MKNIFKNLKLLFANESKSSIDNLHFTCAGLTNKGKVRKSNQDRILIDKDLHLFIVADGMGGNLGGEIASEIAVSETSQYLENNDWKNNNDDETKSLFEKAVTLANQKVLDEGVEQPEYSGMGTTIAMLGIKNNKAFILHVGDSRVYLIKQNSIKQMTVDHSLVNEILNKKIENSAKIKNLNSYKHVITRAIGATSKIAPDLQTTIVEDGDIFLIASDGLTNMVDNKLIYKIIKDNHHNLDHTCLKLIETANLNGGKDNISSILIKATKVQ